MKTLLIIGLFLALTTDNLWVSAAGVLLMSFAVLNIREGDYGY